MDLREKAVEVNETPPAALQALLMLQENLARVGCGLGWLASDCGLADGLTNKTSECRDGLLNFIGTWLLGNST